MTHPAEPLILQASAVAIGGRAVMIEGASGAGKSSLALALIDRGAQLIGDDGLVLEREGMAILASPHERIRGLLEVRNLGIVPFPCRERVPVALCIRLDPAAPRYIEQADALEIHLQSLPLIRLWPFDAVAAIKAELALERFGLPG